MTERTPPSATDAASSEGREEWLRETLRELNEVERTIEEVRPRGRVRQRFLVLFLVAVVSTVVGAVAVEPRFLGSSVLGLAAFVSVATVAALFAPRHKLRALQWRREELLAQIAANPRSR